MKKIAIVVAIVFVIGAITIFLSGGRQEETQPVLQPPVELEAEVAVLVGGNEALGPFLVGNDGMTLYTFKKDEPRKSNCYGDCAVNWPPLSVPGDPVSGEGVGELGVIERDDGVRQVTYNGIPLYFWVNDREPGDANGHGVKGFWSVVRP